MADMNAFFDESTKVSIAARACAICACDGAVPVCFSRACNAAVALPTNSSALPIDWLVSDPTDERTCASAGSRETTAAGRSSCWASWCGASLPS